MMPERHLILGGARSGKTNHAITLAAGLSAARLAPVVYIATAQALDDEMRYRIDRRQNANAPALPHGSVSYPSGCENRTVT